jgi:hypothetical protein
MENPSSIQLLGSTNNEQGDLFTRLTKDLFFSLGYDNLKLDVQSAGRELDIQGEHRFEPRRVIAECKAHAVPMGGAELNKFFGVLTRERKKHQPRPITGYFVSLSGFTNTGIQQERETGDDALILFDGGKVIQELQNSHVIVSMNEATERAGQCANAASLTDAKLESAELIGHSIGYLWVVYFSQGKQRSHFALIHADGTALAPTVAEVIIQAARSHGGCLHSLKYLAPATAVQDSAIRKAEALAHYQKWLGEECGYIQLDGLPADNDLSATKLRLEKLFVPLKATRLIRNIEGGTDDFIEVIDPIGDLLAAQSHLAILASPGGGKSTLLKRIATAYSFPERRKEIEDRLPDRDWLPLYLRCRDLRDRAQRPILELLYGISAFANMDDLQSTNFRLVVSEALRTGKALLLIDGLDEISDEGMRRTFAQNLRTFIGMFPQASVVVTSRIAGFRDIAGVIASVCEEAILASLDKADVLRLCVSWHAEVVADTDKVRKDAADLGKTIWNSEHIRSLVENPLLLTTLLVVKRSNGEIPPTRTQLYQEAVRVLVRTWNVEGYSPLDEGETLARLSYVACSMMQLGVQTLGQTMLIGLLNKAASEMEAELQFAKVSPKEFLQRIEYRSSLLMQTGYQKIDNEFQPVFEFRHLTFQEYLAARGFVQEQYPGRNDEQPLVDVLSPHFQDERWQEVIPLAAVLAGRKADVVIQSLIKTSEPSPSPAELDQDSPPTASYILTQCLVDEVTVTPATLRNALMEVATKMGSKGRWSESILPSALISGKFGNTFRELIEEAYFKGTDDYFMFDTACSYSLRFEALKIHETLFDKSLVTGLLHRLAGKDSKDRIRAALLVMRLAFESGRDEEKAKTVQIPWSEFHKHLLPMLESDSGPMVQAACWAMAWLARHPGVPPSPEATRLFFKHWRQALNPELARKAAWALYRQPLQSRPTFPTDFWGDIDLWLNDEWKKFSDTDNERRLAVLTVAWYRGSPWNDTQLVEMIKAAPLMLFEGTQMLKELGEPGGKFLAELEKRKPPLKTSK